MKSFTQCFINIFMRMIVGWKVAGYKNEIDEF